MDILRIATAGSVDDGKSTLIGRLLYDTKSITKDKMEAIEHTSKRKGLDFIDLSLLTDGLIAEREQGITIDVAHIYFSTDSRKYIIADTPGHVEYTRNMITGASNSEASIVLIDARNGVIEQTRRHLFISSLLNISHVFVCVNKMDLVAYDEAVFLSIKKEVESLASRIGYEGSLKFIPVAAKYGDNIVQPSAKMKWYDGESLLDYLEQTDPNTRDENLPARFPVQFVIRPHSDEHHDFRGYAGQLLSGTISKGERIVVLPTLKTTSVKKILRATEEIQVARAGESITIELDEDIDISRGNMIVPEKTGHTQVNAFTGTVAWMDEQLLVPGKTYWLQHGVNLVKAKISQVQSKIDMQTMEPADDLSRFGLNDIGKVSIRTAKPIFADLYRQNPRNGSFILIDEFSNNTVAVGFIESL